MFEISVIYSVILALILVVFSGVIYFILSQTLYAELDNEVKLKAKEISANINERLKINSENIDSILADLRVTMRNLSGISTNLNERLEVNKGSLDETIVHMKGATKNLEEMSYDLKLNPWKLMYKPRRQDLEVPAVK